MEGVSGPFPPPENPTVALTFTPVSWQHPFWGWLPRAMLLKRRSCCHSSCPLGSLRLQIMKKPLPQSFKHLLNKTSRKRVSSWVHDSVVQGYFQCVLNSAGDLFFNVTYFMIIRWLPWLQVSDIAYSQSSLCLFILFFFSLLSIILFFFFNL